MLQFSANLSLLFQELPWAERFRAARDCGFSAVEIQFPYEMDRFWLAEQLQQHALQLVLINLPAGDLLQGGAGIACHAQSTTAFDQAIALALLYAQTLKIPRLNVLAGHCAVTERQTALEVFIHNLQHAADVFWPHGIQTCFETLNPHDMPGFLIDSVEFTETVLRRCPDQRIAWQADFYHLAHLQADTAVLLQRHQQRLGHVQFADFPGRGAPGTGQIDFQPLLRQLSLSDYQGFIGAEYHPRGSTAASLHWLPQWCKTDAHLTAALPEE